MSDKLTPTASVTVGDETANPGEGEVRVTELFHWAYRFFYSKTVGVILILAFAVLALVGSLIVQASAADHADAASYQAFLERVRPTYGGWTGVLDVLGFFHVFTSIPFYVVVACLALSIIACTTHRIPELVRRQRYPRVHVAKSFYDKARYRGEVVADVGGDQAFEVAQAVLDTHRFRVFYDDRDPGRSLFADRHAWSGIGTVIAHASFVIILLAFVISSTFGIEDTLSIPVGGSVDVGHDSGLVVQAVSFRDSYDEEGRPADYVSELVVTKAGEEVGRQEVRVNAPLVVDGFRFHQSTFGIAADLLVLDPSGVEVLQASVPLSWRSADGSEAIGTVNIPGSDLRIVVATPASGRTGSTIPPGAAVLEIHQGATSNPIAVRPVPQGSATEVAGYTMTFQRERPYTGILLRKDPGTMWMWIGSVLLVVGMSITFLFQYRRLWVRVESSSPADGGPASTRVRLGSVARLDLSFQRTFERITADIDQELAEPSTQHQEAHDG